MSWITESKDLLAASYIKVVTFIFCVSLCFVCTSLVAQLGVKPPFYDNLVSKYGAEILIAFVASLVLIFFWAISSLWERWKTRKGKLIIIKATYGASDDPNDVTDRVKNLITKQNDKYSLNFKADDDIFLTKSKVDDDMPGTPKTFRIEYCYRHTKEYKQGEQVEISN